MVGKTGSECLCDHERVPLMVGKTRSECPSESVSLISIPHGTVSQLELKAPL